MQDHLTLRGKDVYCLIFVQSVTFNARKVRICAFKPVNGYKADFSYFKLWNIPYLLYFFFDLFIGHRKN